MEILPRFFVFAMLFATGDFLECEVCSSPGSSCSGGRETCTKNDDICAVVSIENALEDITVQTVAKDCDSSDACMTPGKSINLGNGRTIHSYSICCIEDACAMEYPQILPMENNTNGKQCPACFSTNGTCVAQMIECLGEEKYCFEMTSTARVGGKSMNATMKGCCTKQVCNSIQEGQANPLKGSGLVFKHGTCISGALARSQTPSLLCPTISGLLLIKIIS